MAIRRILFLVARLSFGLFFLLTSVYCLLAYIPFTYNWVINCTLVSIVPLFAKLHPLLYWMAFSVVAPAIYLEALRPRTRLLAIGFLVFHAILGVALVIHPLLTNIKNDFQSFVWSLIWLFPLMWLSAIDYASHNNERLWRAKAEEINLPVRSAIFSAVFLSALYAAIFYLLFSDRSHVEFRKEELLLAILWSAGCHLLLFTSLVVLLRVVRAISNRFVAATKVEFALCNLLFGLLVALIFKKIILSSLSFAGLLADLFSIAVAATILVFLSGLSIRLACSERGRILSGLGMSLMPLLALVPSKDSSRVWKVAYLAVLCVIAYAIPASIATMDWVFLMQKLGVISVWAMSFVFFFVLTPRSKERRYPAILMIAVAAAGIGFYRVSELSRHHLPGLFDLEHLNVDSALNRYSDYDLSFRIARNILQTDISFFPTTRADLAESSAPELDSFYSFLQENTNIPESVKVSPKEVNIAGRLTRIGGNRPNIFIIVVDSLRQDYVSPYNNRVTFTPSIESFASDSAVFKKAFTSYAGTVLAEPSIWVGAMQLHKQYIEPFYPLNALQRLVEMEGYQCFVTIDPVLEKTMNRSPAIEELDKGLDWVDYDLCRTVEELQAKLDERQDRSRPVFVYTQAQNLHIVMRNHRMRTNPPTESFPGFDAFYASQVKRVDECFGRFIQHLKDRGLYDNSIIILTADHGENLGEGGRWGHGFYLYPELIRIPIIMRIPASLKKEMVWSKEHTALLTDITPSLYYLLGHRPVERNPVFGRPLFTKTEKEQSEYLRPSYLLGSSYGAIYGTISNDGRWLFFSDSTIQEDFYYDLDADPTATRNLLTPTIRQEHRRIIRDYILAISRFYNFGVVRDEPMP